MDVARDRAEAGAPGGSVVAARLQRAGRGRAGRSWQSPRGNLHATAILRPGGGPGQAPQLGFVTALAVADAIDALAGAGCTLKWPNDVLRGGAKLAGILLERLACGAVLVGIGVNVSHAPPGQPYAVTCLAEQGCTADPETVLQAIHGRLLAGFDAWQADGLAPVLQRWRARGPALAAPIQVRLPDELISGRFAGLAADGSLLVESGGCRRQVVAGDVLL